ncbi:MAG: SMP-30/gluconolactonase/LRE family protein [Puniceicoccales bacterium]|nr:SMP-30/gluconolactonase/LRE family protein [Puniceicoccales bacterium]
MEKILLSILGEFLGKLIFMAIGAAVGSTTGCENESREFVLVPEYDKVESATLKPGLLGGKTLPPTYASPDGMAIGPDGCIYVSVTQRASKHKYPAKIIRITPNDTVENFFTMPVNKATGKACPMGLVFDAKGDLYVADNQSSLTKEPGQSSLYRITIEEGKAVRAEKVATGINAANGVTRWGDHIYVAESNLRVPGENLSGVYRFAIADLKAEAPVTVTGRGDPRLITAIQTENKARRGANGIDFDSKGRLYVNNFGDSEVRRLTFDSANGPVSKSEIFARFDPTVVKCVDGLHIDNKDNLWIADLAGNAILKITPEGAATIVARNAVSDDADGALNTPSECIRRGAKLYISNMDIGEIPRKNATQTISVLALGNEAK